MTIPTEDMTQWDSDIKLAESNRPNNPAAMDIMGSRLSQMGTNDDSNCESSSDTSGNAWIMLGLGMEERQ